MALTRDEMIQKITQVKAVEVEGLGEVHLKPLLASAFFTLTQDDSPESLANIPYAVIAACLCDATGTLMFSEKEVKEIFSVEVVNSLAPLIMGDNGLTKEAEKTLKKK